jgi:uncharacterized protein (DUF697 family)
MATIGAGNIFQIIREIDLSRIRQEAETRFHLLVSGKEELAQALALRLSEQPGKVGVHPWLVVEADPTRRTVHELGRYELALFVTERIEPSEDESRVLRHLAEAGLGVVVVIVGDALEDYVGTDLPRPLETARVVLPAALEPGVLREHLVPVLLEAVSRDLRLSLARQLPIVREVAIRELIEETSRANALYTASTGLARAVPILNIPLNVADIVVLTKNQLVMAYRIALMTGKRGEPREVLGEIVGVVGGGFFFRQVARELVGLVPVIGIVPNVAVSYAGTRVIGHSVYLWACRDERLSGREVRRMYREAMSQGMKFARSLLRRRREKAALPAPKDEDRDQANS